MISSSEKTSALAWKPGFETTIPGAPSLIRAEYSGTSEGTRKIRKEGGKKGRHAICFTFILHSWDTILAEFTGLEVFNWTLMRI